MDGILRYINTYLYLLVNVYFSQILLDFPHATAKIPFEYLFDLIPPMQPRAMSIASSNLVSLPKDSGGTNN